MNHYYRYRPHSAVYIKEKIFWRNQTMNKKLLAILLAAVMLLALAACGDEPAPTPTPDPDPVDTPNEGGEDAQSVLTMYTFMDTVPDLVGTAWSFIGGCVDGKMMTEDQVTATLSQLDDYYQFYFNDETTVTLYQGNDTAPEGTYSAVNDTTVKIEVEGVTYAAVFAEGENGPIMVALLDSTGTNALVFEMVAEG
jgi:predicted small lipoprotein YifL